MTLILWSVVGLVAVPATIVAVILGRYIRKPFDMTPGLEDFRRFKG